MKTQTLGYPVELTEDPDGGYIAQAVDIPEALTFGGSKEEALLEIEDAVLVALSGYEDEKRDIPAPSKPKRDQYTVYIPPLIGAKLALYNTVRIEGITNVALGERIGASESAVRRLLNLDHRSHIGQIEHAMEALGKRLAIAIVDTA